MTLITGGSKCGRSALGESLTENFPGAKFYIATMQPFGTEAQAAIARHRRMRAGKGFQTIEQYTDLEQLLLPEGCAVLLECTGNLLANEMFSAGRPDAAEHVLNGILRLREHAAELVVIHSEVGADGIAYPPQTMDYLRAMGELGQALSAAADRVIECVYGLPIVHKGVL